MEATIKNIISSSDAPVYDLDIVADGLHGQELSQFHDVLIALVHRGNEREKFVALNVLSVAESIDKGKLVNQIIKGLSVEDNHKILTPIIRMIQEGKMNQYEEFCVRAFQYAKNTSNNKLFVSAFRCLLKLDWRRVIVEVSNLFRATDDISIVDTLAFFRSIHDERQYALLLDSLEPECQQRAKRLNAAIDKRLKEHYLAIQ